MLFSTRQETLLPRWTSIPNVIQVFLGERDDLSLPKKQLNHIAANYSNHYPEEVLEPVRRDLKKTEQAILDLEEFAFDAEDLKPGQKKDFGKNATRRKSNMRRFGTN